MQKLFVLLCSSVVFLFLVTACENKEEADTQIGEEFIKELYNVNEESVDVNEMSPEQLVDFQDEFSTYFTEKEFEDLANKRVFLLPLEAASEQNSKISVKNIEFKQGDDEQDFDHSFTLIFTDEEGNETEEMEIKGQMSIVNTEDGLKIDRYYDGEPLKTFVNK